MEGKLFLGLNLIWVMLLLGQLHGYQSCIHKEKMALLEIKKYIISNIEKQRQDSVFPTWTNDTTSDCCQWKEIKCNLTSQRVTEIAFQGLISDKDNFLLNLSLLHPFEEVRSLNFSGETFTYSPFTGFFDDVEGYKSLGRLKKLEILDLSFNRFNNSILHFLNVATSLTTLYLGNNHIDGHFPVKELKDLTNLELLDLGNNEFNGSIPVQVLTTLRKLKALDLSDNKFSGSMEWEGICELKNMQELDLSHNKLVGEFPLCLTSLTRLRVLDLSSNQLTGKLPSDVAKLESLEYLSLFDNNFEGLFSLGWLTNLSKLKVFKLYSKSNLLQVEFKSSWKPTFQLSVIALRSCNLEKVPHFLLHQKDLRYVDISDNGISGIFPSWLLENNTMLSILLLRNNSFTSFQLPESAHNLSFMDVSVNNFNQVFPKNIGFILPYLRHMNLSNNAFEGNLPSSLGNMKMMIGMDLSHNHFHGKLPRSFVKGCDSLVLLKLSHNKLSGEIFQESPNFIGMSVMSMDNNQFTGKIGNGLRSFTRMFFLDISNNNLTGVIPSWISEFQELSALLISNNSLEGEIPVSLFNLSARLDILDISSNKLSGVIPPPIRSVPSALFLQDNKLSGVIPDIVQPNVEILDLRNNFLSGNIPEVVYAENISILLLRGNNLTGHIPRQLCGLRNIQLLDLSNNKLNGSIPSCLSNASFDLSKEDTTFKYDYNNIRFYAVFLEVDMYFKSLLKLDSFHMKYKGDAKTKIEFATKHRYDTYIGGNLKLLFGMDFSKNELSGDIPFELGGLLELQGLNLSHNNLSGVIPESFSGLKNMESLDLSFNRLQGRIPPQLTEISSLAVFNVSYNNLSGVIPQGRQFNTFQTDSYFGNYLLCGQSINRSCNSSIFQEHDNKEEADESIIDMESFYWSSVAAYVTILLGIFASLSFDSPWSRFWFYIGDVIIYKVKNLLW